MSIVNPKPFLNDLTGKDVIVKLKWGMEYEGSGVAAPILKVAPVPIISKAECGAAGVYPNRLTNSMFCAGKLKTGGVDGCQGYHEDGWEGEERWLRFPLDGWEE